MISRSPSLVVFRVEVRHQEGGLLLSGMASTQDEQAGIEAMLGFAASSHPSQEEGGEDEDDQMEGGCEDAVVPGSSQADMSHLVC